jgi:hypothetical protein
MAGALIASRGTEASRTNAIFELYRLRIKMIDAVRAPVPRSVREIPHSIRRGGLRRNLRICKGLATERSQEVPDWRAFAFFDFPISQGRTKEDCRNVRCG